MCLALAFLFGTLAVPLLASDEAPVPAVIEWPIQAGESHSFTFQLAAGQFLGAVVEQIGIDLVVEVFDQQGNRLLKMDGPDYWLWEEEIALVAEASGAFRLVIHPLQSYAPPASYRLRVNGSRAAREDDRVRVEAADEMLAAHAANDRSDPAARLKHLETARQLWQSLNERRREGEVVYQMLDALADLGRMDEAQARLREAAAIWQEIGLPEQRAWTLLGAWRSDRSLYEWDELQQLLEEALSLARQAKSRFLEVRALYTLARFHQRRPRIAKELLEPALKIARELRDPEQELYVLYQLAFALEDLAEKQEALDLYEKALSLAREIRQAGVENNTLISLGYFYVSLGQLDKGVDYLEQALALSRVRRDVQKESAALNNLAAIYKEIDPARSRSLYERSLELGLASRDRELQANALSSLASLDLRDGNPLGALERAAGALPLTAGIPASEVAVRVVMGNAHRQLGNLEASRRELDAALRLARAHEDRVREALVLPNSARTEIQAADLQGARAYLEEGIRVIESLRAEIAQEELRATYLASRKDTYELYIDTLMGLHRQHPKLGYDAEALQAAERTRARSLLDILAEAGADIREGADPALVERERRLLAEIETREQRRLTLLDQGAASAEIGVVSSHIAAALATLRETEAALRVSSPHYAALTQPQPLSVSEIQREVLDGRALLLQYALGEERSYLWAVGPDSLQTFELPPRVKIEAAARRWYLALQLLPESEGGLQAADEARRAEEELSAILLRPVEALLHGQPLLVVGDGALQYLPFAALPIPSSLAEPRRVRLIERHEVASLPSASVLAALRHELAGRAAAPKRLAVLADPVFRPGDLRVLGGRAREAPNLTAQRGVLDLRAGEVDPRQLPRLRFSEIEAEAIAELVPEPLRFKAVGFAASRATAISGELGRYQMVHFATHGLIDSRRPELSSLVLSLVNERGEPQNGFLRLHDIYNLKLHADLVVLSACQTALGQEIRGEGLVGLTRGFMYAGAARVLASLWSVDDRATSVLMQRFYRQMISGGLSPAAALRQAQIEMLREPRWHDPYFWAGFSLQGEWQ